ncbi:ankyrin repeat domain-containing protein [Thioalkalivibrio sp. ALJ16]|uniref:ankyrin repeat domain-containing protein n=1 Tax=Thioalkalivibrio sp. ALJ16 TaxID=1158762 RepID=UPI0003656263|nr:ankyrin repeat domain-containing protein [Thioalkalivibrio sp. ALJ16]
MNLFYKPLAMVGVAWLVAVVAVVPAFASGQQADQQLYQAVARGDIDQAESLIAQGADVNQAHRPWELTPLLVAVGIDETLTDRLLEAGADVNAREREGVTVLMKAVHGGDAGIVRRLLKEPDLDVDARGPRGNTALTYAVLYGYPAMVEALVNRGADVDVVRGDGATPKSLALHMHGLALAMPEDEAGDSTDHGEDAAHSHEHHHGHSHAHDSGAGAAEHQAMDGPHDHHRSRTEAVDSYSRVLATLARAGATDAGEPPQPGDSGGHHGHHHH